MQDIWNEILKANHIVITMHRRPDGDAIGSALGLFNVLVSMKRVSLFNISKEIKREFGFLPGFDRIRDTLPGKFDLMITLDSASLDLVRIERPDAKIINIDHHKSNTNFGDWNLVDDTLPSCGEVVFKLLESNHVKLNRPAALCLYASLASDTNFFTTDRVDADTFATAAKLLAYDISPYEVAREITKNRPLSQVRLNGEALSRFALHVDGQVASVVVDQGMQQRTAGTLLESDQIADELLNLATVKVGVMLYEVEGRGVKVSMRGKDRVDLSEVAARYGGGGHKNAAGIFVKGVDPAEFEKVLLEDLRGLLS